MSSFPFFIDLAGDADYFALFHFEGNLLENPDVTVLLGIGKTGHRGNRGVPRLPGSPVPGAKAAEAARRQRR